MNIFTLIKKLIMPTRLYLGGGGDGGAQAEADRVRVEDSQREYQIAQDKSKINALFGITDYDYGSLPELLYGAGGSAPDNQIKYQAEVDRLTNLISEADADPDYAGSYGATEGGYYSGDFDRTPGTAPWQSQLTDAQLELDRATNAIGDYDASALSEQAASAFDTREATLEGIYGDILGKYDFEQDRQYDRKSADIKAMLASRGLSRSTVGQSIFDRLGELRDTNTTSFEEGASDAITRIRAADTQTLEGLIAQIDAGGDYNNARTTALSDLTNNIDTSVGQANARDLTNLFAGMDELYGQKQYVDAYNEGQTYGSSNIVTPGSAASSSGSVLTY